MEQRSLFDRFHPQYATAGVKPSWGRLPADASAAITRRTRGVRHNVHPLPRDLPRV